MKKDTLEQLSAFQKGLDDIANKNLSLNDEVKKAKLKIQEAFKSHANVQVLLKKISKGEASSFRDKIQMLDGNYNTKKISQNDYVASKLAQIGKLQEIN